MKQMLLAALLLVSACVAPLQALAEGTYPSRPVKVIVPQPPGGGFDFVAKSAPDGYTLLTGSVSNLALNPGLYRNFPYDSLRDFEPLGIAVSYSYTLMARKDLPLNSLQEVVAFSRANPVKLTYASAGGGSGQHVLAAAPGGKPVSLAAAETRALVQRDVQRWTRLIREAGIRAE